MNKKDIELIEKAKHTTWEYMDNLIAQCESQEARDTIEYIRRKEAIRQKCYNDF